MRKMYLRTRPLAPRICNICGFEGYFESFGRPPRLDARCPICHSLERHRLFWLWFDGKKERLAEPILHFAPEHILEKRFRSFYKNYKTADLFKRADLRLNIENLKLPDASIRTIVCNHVLEHVDDKQALLEINRVLTDDGKLICSVPIIEGWEHTYENIEATSEFDRLLHFGQGDHIRYYGRDFRQRLKNAGFQKILEITAEGPEVITYGLERGDKFFICSKI